jgi:hypothetical protein
MGLVFLMLVSPAFGQVQVFVTSERFDGFFGDQAGGDDVCTMSAINAGLDGNWTAWLGKGSCGACDDPRDRILDAEYQLLDGTVVANSLADLTDGTLDHAINVDEFQNPVVTEFEVWTGCGADGTGSFGPGTCTVWTTNADTVLGRIGLANATNDQWTDEGQGDPNTGGQTCDTRNRVYCFSAFEVPVELQEFSVE